ncbi:MAG TPA: DUF6152 family protein [Gammaproteobacteria bacterium]
MSRRLTLCISALLLAAPAMVAAHHSFAVYDMEKDVVFEGVVETLKLRNPHMSMTLATEQNGERRIVNFVEGAPANMLVRMGVDPASIKPGAKIKAIGSPRKDDPEAFFLKTIILEDGTRYDTLGGGAER